MSSPDTSHPTNPIIYAVATFVYATSIPFESATLNLPTPLTYISASLLVVAGLHALITRKFHIIPTHALILVCAFFFWNLLAYFWSVDPTASQSRILTLGMTLATVLAFMATAGGREIIAAFNGFVFGGLIASLFVLQAYAVRDNAGSEIRITALGANANDLGGQLAIAAIVAVALPAVVSDQLKPHVKSCYLITGIVLAVAALSTGSRTVLIALTLGVALSVAAGRRAPIRRLAITATVAALAIAIAFNTLDPRILERLAGTRGSLATGELNARGDLWAVAFQFILERLAYGWGPGSSSSLLSPTGLGQGVTHNSWIGTTLELGLIGLGILLAIALAALTAAWHSPYRTLFVPAFAAMITMSLTLSWEYRKAFWLVLGIGMAIAVINHNDKGGSRRENHDVV